MSENSTEACENTADCEAFGSDICDSTDFAETHCRKYCGLCGGLKHCLNAYQAETAMIYMLDAEVLCIRICLCVSIDNAALYDTCSV